MVVECLPSPLESQRDRVNAVVHANREKIPFRNDAIEKAIAECDQGDQVETTAFISKMVSVPVEFLPANRRVQLTPEELRERRRVRMEALATASVTGDDGTIALPPKDALVTTAPSPPPGGETQPTSPPQPQIVSPPPPSEVFIGFGRVFSGTLKKGQEVYVLGPKYNPLDQTQHFTKVKVEALFLLMGRDLEELDEVPAGNLFGILGLGDIILKTATISTTLDCPSFGQLHFEVSPILRVALEPKNPAQMPQLVEGLKLLNQADPSVEISVQETGEHILAAIGELHLERCMKDLRERFSKIEIEQSDPIVPFRETIASETKIAADNKETLSAVTVSTPEKVVTLSIKATPLPQEVVDVLEANNQPGGALRCLIDRLDIEDVAERKRAAEKTGALADSQNTSVQDFLTKLKEAFDAAGPKWRGTLGKIISFGPKRIGSNILISNIPGITVPPYVSNLVYSPLVFRFHQTHLSTPTPFSFWKGYSDSVDAFGDAAAAKDGPCFEFQGSAVTGFQLATFAGPLCEEPLMGVCYSLEALDLKSEDTEGRRQGFLGGQVISAMKDGCRQAFLGGSPRLMLAQYSCDIHATCESHPPSSMFPLY